MTKDEQIQVCKTIAAACMWGHGGIGSTIVDDLQECMPTDPTWQDVYNRHKQQAKIDAVGCVNNAVEINRLYRDGYSLCNYEPGRLSIHMPAKSGGGLFKYITGDLAEHYGKLFDAWNYDIYQKERKGP